MDDRLLAIVITAISATLIFAVSLVYMFRLRRAERDGSQVKITSNDRVLGRIFLGTILGITLCKGFYSICGIQITIFSSAPFIRQCADFVCIAAYICLGICLFGKFGIFKDRNKKNINQSDLEE